MSQNGEKQKYETFQDKYTEPQRIKMVKENRVKYPNMVLIVFEKEKNCTLEINTYLSFFVKGDVQILDLFKQFRSKINNIDRKQHLQFYIGNAVIQPTNSKVSDIYEIHKNQTDEVLYVYYSNLESYG